MLYRLFISPIYVIFQEKNLNHKKASRQLLSYLFLKPLPLLCLIISHFGQSDYEKPDNRGTSTAKKPLPKAPENGKFYVILILCLVERPPFPTRSCKLAVYLLFK